MLYTGIKGYLKRLMIYFKSWRILIPVLITLYLLVVDQSTNYLISYNIAYVLWILYYSQSASNKSKEWRMLCLLPSNARLRFVHMVTEAIGMTVILTLWRSCIYMIELLLNLCTLQRAAHRFFGMDLIIIMLISIMSRVVSSKANISKIKNKPIYYTVFVVGSILLCTHVILFILNIEQVWLSVAFTSLAYLSVAAMWCVLLRGLRVWNFNYETMMAGLVKQKIL